MDNISELELAYIAGFIDGDGFITISRHHGTSTYNGEPIYYVMVGASQREPEILEWIKSKVGGSIRPWSQNGHKQHRWNMFNRKAMELCFRLEPYSISKKYYIKIVKLFPTGNSGCKLNDNIKSTREDLYLEMKKLQLRKG